MPPQRLNADYLFQGQAQYEILRKNHWTITIANMDVELLCSSVKLPKTTLAVIEVNHYNDMIKVAGKPSTSNGTIEVMDAVAPSIIDELNQWWLEAYDPTTGQMGYPSAYKQPCVLNQYDNGQNLIRTVQIAGSWLSSQPITEDAFTYDNADLVKVQVTLICDHVYYDNGGNNGNAQQ